MIYPFVQAANDYGLRKGPVMAFVVHMAEGGGTVSYLSKPNPRGVSVHYVIDYGGHIVQMLRENHASGSINPNELRTTDDPEVYGATVRKQVMGAWDHDPNAAVISCELEGFARDGPNATQAIALDALVEDVRSRFPEMGLLGHRDFQDYKPCPGQKIVWSVLGGHGPKGDDMIAFHAPQNEVGGTLTVTRDTEAIPIQGGTRLPLKAGLSRPTLGVFTLDAVGNRPSYLMLVGPTLAFVPAADVTFTPGGATTDCSALEAKLAAVRAALA